MTPNGKRSWWARKFWVIVMLPVIAAVALAGVSVFKGWLHNQAGFDPDGKPLDGGKTTPPPVQDKKPEPKPRTPITAEAGYRLILDDLNRRDPDVRPRLRYLTLWHRHNEPSCTTENLEAERTALRELAALLLNGRAGRAEFSDPEQRILRFDLDEFGWDAANEWRAVCSQYRYGLSAVNGSPLAEAMRRVEELTGDKIPVVRGDWFVAAVTRPPLAAPTGVVTKPAA